MTSVVHHLEPSEIIRLHDRNIVRYGGLPGLADSGRVHALIARVRNYEQYEGISDIPALCALYCVAIARGHVFCDGNKRTSINAAILFGRRNGFWFQPAPDMEDFVVNIASGQVSTAEAVDYFKNLPSIALA